MHNGVAVPVDLLTKGDLMERFGVSDSTIRRDIAFLDEVIPDEFNRVPRQKFFTPTQAGMIAWVRARIVEGYEYAQIEQQLQKGFPDDE